MWKHIELLYDQLRRAFVDIYKWYQGTANKCLILLGHVKTSSINKEGKDLNARDLQLTGINLPF